MLKLETLKPNKGSNKANTRVGRGQGSGGGGTAKRGHQGAKSRSGYSQKKGFEGGQMPLQRRVPKFGFKNANRVVFKAVNLDTLDLIAKSSGLSTIDLDVMFRAGVVSQKDLVKILGRGEVSSAIEVKANAFSKSAVEAIEKAGGKAIVDGTFTGEIGEKIKLNSVTKDVVVVEKVEKPKIETKKTAKIIAELDDFKKIEGIGPKIAGLLVDAGITTFAGLSQTGVEKLNEILAEAGSRYASHNPTTWPQQAALAADGKWEELKELQDSLTGGRPE